MLLWIVAADVADLCVFVAEDVMNTVVYLRKRSHKKEKTDDLGGHFRPLVAEGLAGRRPKGCV